MPKQRDYQEAMQKQERKEKLRKVKKNIQPKVRKEKPRFRNWTPRGDENWDDEIFLEDERIMPRGSQEKRRQTAQAAESVSLRDHEQDDAIDIGPGNDFVQGLVIEVSANRCRVLVEGEVLDCSFRRVMLKHDSAFTKLAVAGDDVLVTRLEEDVGVVETILPRRSMLARPHRSDKGKLSSQVQVVAANIDQVLVVASWRMPAIWPELIDRYLIAAERNQLEAVICVNKIDLVEYEDDLQAEIQPYRDAGYQVLLTSAETGAGIENLRSLLKDTTTVFTGLSGVGKSSLLSQVQPGLSLRALTVGERGKNRNQGRHTTTIATLYPLKEGGAVIDTPGIREFGLAFLDRSELAGFYPEMAALQGQCRYNNCSHTHEPGCTIKAAVEEGEIAKVRYENYTKILSDLPG